VATAVANKSKIGGEQFTEYAAWLCLGIMRKQTGLLFSRQCYVDWKDPHEWPWDANSMMMIN